MSLETASEEEQLAIDLIMLLEENRFPSKVVLAALQIVRKDYLSKIALTADPATRGA